MRQSRLDSLMEALVNIAIGLAISTVANHFVLPGVLHVHMSVAQNVVISLIFTAISLARSYAIRWAFNGKSVWHAIRGLPA